MDNVDLKPANLLNDISPCDFAQVSWVIPIGQNSDQPGNPNTVGGPSWVASIVNAIEGVFWISGRARLDLRTNVPLGTWAAFLNSTESHVFSTPSWRRWMRISFSTILGHLSHRITISEVAEIDSKSGGYSSKRAVVVTPRGTAGHITSGFRGMTRASVSS